MASEAGRRGPGPGPLAEYAARAGELRVSAANRPVELRDPEVAWLVVRGALDVSVAEYADGRVLSAFRHVLRLGPGRLAFGAGNGGTERGFKLVGKGLPDSRLYRIPIPPLLDEVAKDPGGADLARALAVGVDAWVEDFAGAVARVVAPRPPSVLQIEPGQDAQALTTGILTARHGVVWIRGEALEAAFLETEDAGAEGPGLMPVTPDAWIALRRTEGIACVSSAELDPGILVRRALPEFHRLAFGAEASNRRLMLADEANLQAAQVVQRRREEAAARRSLEALSRARAEDPAADRSALVAALQAIGRHEGISIRTPVVGEGLEPSLDDIVRASGVRARRVRLSAEARWWLGDSGAMLAFRREDDRPVALLPGAGGRYRVLDPTTGRSERADAGTTGELLEDARLLYRTLPNDRPAGVGDLAAVAGGGRVAGDLVRLAVAGVGAGILALAPAVAVNVLIGSVIPSGDPGALVQLAGVLVGLSFMAALSQLFRGTALMRLEGRMVARMSAALWDRLLRLRPRFFRGFTSGELASRAAAFQELRDRVSGAVADALLSVLFLLPMFALLFHYDTALGWLTLGLGLAALALTSLVVGLLLGPQRRHVEMTRELAGELFQFINGIGKLRTTGTEGSAFAAWAHRYRELKRAWIRISVLTEYATAFSAAVPALAGAALFAVALRQGKGGLAPADFLAVYTASMVFYMAVVRLGQSLQAVATIVPGCEQVHPIVRARPDSAPGGGARVTLQGEIAFQRISFRYSERGPMVLRDVTIHVRPGELVAIVGESGVGKSTLFRIALGLEEPLSGAVYYDGKDLAHLDRDAVRRQVGVVTQEGRLQGGNVLDNIIGVTNDLGVDDAWRAARRAAVERDIAAMPMQMLTTVGENASTFSGGQIQRIRIAAALVHEPRILLLDEPTSWLDTMSQAETMEGIEKSVGTRIVIAHRLSTIRKADRIYVLQDGRVVQAGEFEELLGQEGPFRDLARRQMV